jgi:hypothetical protein
MQCKKLNLKSHCTEFCISTTYSIECKSDLGRLTVYSRSRSPKWVIQGIVQRNLTGGQDQAQAIHTDKLDAR